MTNAPFLERTIPGTWDHTIEVICWAGSRLFSVGLSGDGLKEWDLTTLTPKRTFLLTGDKGICMDFHQSSGHLAVGTEEGIVNILDLNDDDLQFVRLLDRQDHRIICCKYHENGEKLVSGSLDAVKVWNVKTGQVIHKISTGRAEPNQETIVWCVDIINDFTIITGDSRGKVTFYDGNLGSQIDYVHASTADIMCLSVSSDRKSFFCSGVEQILKKYTNVAITRAGVEVDQWVRCAKRSKIHTHDVLSMVSIGNEKLISGGIDGFLSFATQDFKNFERTGPFLRRPFAEAAEEGRLMLMKYVNYLEVWKLAGATEVVQDFKDDDDDKLFDDEDVDVLKAIQSERKANQLYRISDFPEKFLELRSKRDETIVCCAISSDGHWIAYSTMGAIRLFRFELQENSKPMLNLMKNTPDEFTPCLNMMFSKDSNTLVTAKSDGTCSVFQLVSGAVEHKEPFDISEHHSDLVHLIAISSCSKFLILASLCNSITVWNLKRGKWTHMKTFPKYACPATSLSIRKDNPVAVISFSDNKLLEYNIEGHFIQFTAALPAKESSINSAITNVCLDPRNPDAILFCRDNAIHVLQKNVEKVSNKKAKVVEATGPAYSVKVVKSFVTVSGTSSTLGIF